jgi:hypothetical protein
VHLPALPPQPEQFRLPDWQTVRHVLQGIYGRDIVDETTLRGEDVSPAELARAFLGFQRVDGDRVTAEVLGRYLLDSPAGTTLLIADVQYSGDGYTFDDGLLSVATSHGGQIEITSPKTGKTLAGITIPREPGVIRYIVGFDANGTSFSPIPELPKPDAKDQSQQGGAEVGESGPLLLPTTDNSVAQSAEGVTAG